MKTILVTGGAGFIGSFLVDSLIKRKYSVRVLDLLDPQVHRNSEKPTYLNEHAEYLWGDVRDPDCCGTALEAIDIVFHFAAVVGVGQSQYEIRRYVDHNVGGTSTLLEEIVRRRTRIKKLIIAASMSSYGEGAYCCPSCGEVEVEQREGVDLDRCYWEPRCPECRGKLEPLPTSEWKTQDCRSVYAATKKAQEDLAMAVGQAYNVPTVCLRFFNVYGPRQSLSNPYTGVAAIFLSRIKNGHRPVIYEDGRQTRDFISVHDVVRANLLVMENDCANFQRYNVGTGTAISIRELADLLLCFGGGRVEAEVTGKYRKGDIRHCVADISRISADLGFHPCVSLTDGMSELYEWSKSAQGEDAFDAARRELERRGLA